MNGQGQRRCKNEVRRTYRDGRDHNGHTSLVEEGPRCAEGLGGLLSSSPSAGSLLLAASGLLFFLAATSGLFLFAASFRFLASGLLFRLDDGTASLDVAPVGDDVVQDVEPEILGQLDSAIRVGPRDSHEGRPDELDEVFVGGRLGTHKVPSLSSKPPS